MTLRTQDEVLHDIESVRISIQGIVLAIGVSYLVGHQNNETIDTIQQNCNKKIVEFETIVKKQQELYKELICASTPLSSLILIT
jgi:Zn-dependent oligopeptidase